MPNWNTYVNASPIFSLLDTLLRDDVSQAADEDRIEGATLGQFLAYLLGGYAPNIQALSGDLTLTDASVPVQSLDTNGSARNVFLPAAAEMNHLFFIWNRGAETITVRDSGDTTTIATIATGTAGIVFPDGVNGYASVSGGGTSTGGLSIPETWIFG